MIYRGAAEAPSSRGIFNLNLASLSSPAPRFVLRSPVSGLRSSVFGLPSSVFPLHPLRHLYSQQSRGGFDHAGGEI